MIAKLQNFLENIVCLTVSLNFNHFSQVMI